MVHEVNLHHLHNETKSENTKDVYIFIAVDIQYVPERHVLSKLKLIIQREGILPNIFVRLF